MVNNLLGSLNGFEQTLFDIYFHSCLYIKAYIFVYIELISMISLQKLKTTHNTNILP